MGIPIEELIKAQRQREEEERRRNSLLGILGSGSQVNPWNSLLASGLLQPKRKVFISYHHEDDTEVRAFVKRWAETEQVFTPKGLGLRFTDDIINSDDPE